MPCESVRLVSDANRRPNEKWPSNTRPFFYFLRKNMTVKIGSTDFPIHQKNWVIPTIGCNHSDNIMLDGPPYANGNIHIGHVVNRYIKDTIVRANALYWRPGFDCHGLPIEREIEKTGLSKDDPNFLSAAREYAFGQTENQTAQLRISAFLWISIILIERWISSNRQIRCVYFLAWLNLVRFILDTSRCIGV